MWRHLLTAHLQHKTVLSKMMSDFSYSVNLLLQINKKIKRYLTQKNHQHSVSLVQTTKTETQQDKLHVIDLNLWAVLTCFKQTSHSSPRINRKASEAVYKDAAYPSPARSETRFPRAAAANTKRQTLWFLLLSQRTTASTMTDTNASDTQKKKCWGFVKLSDLIYVDLNI